MVALPSRRSSAAPSKADRVVKVHVHRKHLTLVFAPLCFVGLFYFPVRCGIHWLRTGKLRFWPEETQEQLLYRELWWRRTLADWEAGRY